MLQSIFAIKTGMTQAWDNNGRRWSVTKCHVADNLVVEAQPFSQDHQEKKIYILGFGKKKLKNMKKPLRTKIEKSGFSFGVRYLRGVQAKNEAVDLKPGDRVTIDQVLEVGDVVMVRGITKGRGFAGAMKRHGFAGGPRTHGQSDRARAVGSIGAGSTPGRVFKGKKMPGHYGQETKTIKGLVVLHIDQDKKEVWLSGPVPGSKFSWLQIIPSGQKKKVSLDAKASNIELPATPAEPESQSQKTEQTEDKK